MAQQSPAAQGFAMVTTRTFISERIRPLHAEPGFMQDGRCGVLQDSVPDRDLVDWVFGAGIV